MRYHENIEKIFADEVRDKKRTGRGAFSMRGKGVKHGISGALRTPYHFMTTREKNKLNGEVEVSNMFTTILNWPEFSSKDKETQKNLMTKWREIYPNKKIMDELAEGKGRPFNSQSFNDLVADLGCPKKTRGGAIPRKSKAKIKQEEKQQMSSQQQELSLKETPVEAKQILITKGLHLEFNGQYDVEALNRLFTKLQLLIDGEPNKYNISLSLSEIEED